MPSRLPRVVPIQVLLVAALCAPNALAEVYKCVDAAGRVTYQETRCVGVNRGGPVELLLDNGNARESADTESRWRAAAATHEVVTGMPKRWVQQALGLPAQVQRGAPADAASEVWTYRTPAGVTRIGFAANVVAWQRTEARPPASGAADGADAVRSRVAADRDCAEVLAELGPPAGTQPIEQDGGLSAGAVRYTYDPVPGGLPVRLTFSCAAGRVVAVSRGIPR